MVRSVEAEIEIEGGALSIRAGDGDSVAGLCLDAFAPARAAFMVRHRQANHLPPAIASLCRAMAVPSNQPAGSAG